MDVNKNIWVVIFRLSGFDVSSISEHYLKKIYLWYIYVFPFLTALFSRVSNISYWGHCKIHPSHLFTMCFFIPTSTLGTSFQSCCYRFCLSDLIFISFLFHLRSLEVKYIFGCPWFYSVISLEFTYSIFFYLE